MRLISGQKGDMVRFWLPVPIVLFKYVMCFPESANWSLDTMNMML